MYAVFYYNNLFWQFSRAQFAIFSSWTGYFIVSLSKAHLFFSILIIVNLFFFLSNTDLSPTQNATAWFPFSFEIWITLHLKPELYCCLVVVVWQEPYLLLKGTLNKMYFNKKQMQLTKTFVIHMKILASDVEEQENIWLLIPWILTPKLWWLMLF